GGARHTRIGHPETLTGHPIGGSRDPRARVSTTRVNSDLTARQTGLHPWGRHSVSPTRSGERRTPVRGRRALKSAGALGLLALAATGCSGTRLGLPEPISVQGERVLRLWQGSWIAAFAVGSVVWGLIIWAVLFHRKRSDDLPPQVRYNMPIEILYTAVPFVIIAVLFYFTARDENFVEKTTDNPQVVVDVTGFQWSWRFDYKQGDETVASVTGVPVAPNGPAYGKPVLTIPAGKTVRVRL